MSPASDMQSTPQSARRQHVIGFTRHRLLLGSVLLVLAGTVSLWLWYRPAKDSSPSPAAAPRRLIADGNLAHELHSRLNEIIPDYVSGAVVIQREDEVLVSAGFGTAYPPTQRPVTTGTVFDIGSVAKTITGLAAMRLSEEGVLDLDAPISRYLPQLPSDRGVGTIQQALEHTGGWPTYLSGGDFTAKTREQALHEFTTVELVGPPGKQNHYSNVGYHVVAMAIEQASGEDFQDVIRSRVIEPLELSKTGFYGDVRWSTQGVAHGRTGRRIHGSPASWGSPSWNLIGAGGMAATAENMASMIFKATRGGFLSHESVRLFEAPASPSDWTSLRSEQIYNHRTGIGIFGWTDQAGRTCIFKGGSNDYGFMGFILWRPDTQISLAAFFSGGVIPGNSAGDAAGDSTIEHSTLYRKLISLAGDVPAAKP